MLILSTEQLLRTNVKNTIECKISTFYVQSSCMLESEGISENLFWKIIYFCFEPVFRILTIEGFSTTTRQVKSFSKFTFHLVQKPDKSRIITYSAYLMHNYILNFYS